MSENKKTSIGKKMLKGAGVVGACLLGALAFLGMIVGGEGGSQHQCPYCGATVDYDDRECRSCHGNI